MKFISDPFLPRLTVLFCILIFSLVSSETVKQDPVKPKVSPAMSKQTSGVKSDDKTNAKTGNTTKKDPCPGQCSCIGDSRIKDASLLKPMKVVCKDKSLKDFPLAAELPEVTTTLDLSRNKIAKITSVDKMAYLRALDLSHNEIAIIEPEAFQEIDSIESLDLSFNSLATIENKIFAKLSSLRKLDLSNNDITKLAEDSFDNQQWLEVLNLADNDLKRLPDSLFRENERLRFLDLSKNKLYSLPDILFHSTPALTSLILSENQFTVVPAEDLASATKLEELDLSQNLMKKLDHQSFNNLNFLKTLRINNCKQLTEIDDYTFAYLNTLQTLEIKFNPRLTYISPSAFFDLGLSPMNLTTLDLNGNQLFSLTEHTLPFCNVTYLDLRDNQWKCDCHFKWVKSCKQDDPIHQQIRCTSPLQIANLEISVLDESQFVCPNESAGYSREIRLFRLFVVLFGVCTLVFMGFLVIYYLHKAKVIRSFGHKYQRMGSIHYVKAPQPTEVPE